MSTRSEIGILNNDSTVTSIYCHWDGYPEYNGKILSLYYKSEEKARKLIKNGDLSSLAENINPNENFNHDFERPQDYVCVYYHRDRGEPWEQVKPRTYSDVIKWVKEIKKGWQEYIYLFKNGNWFFTRTNKIKWQKLKKAAFLVVQESSNATQAN